MPAEARRAKWPARVAAIFGLFIVADVTAAPQRSEGPPRTTAAIATPPAIAEQPLIRSIYNWGDDIAVITGKWVPSRRRSIYSLAIVDRGRSRIVRFRAISCDSYEDVGYSEQLGKIVVCGRRDGALLYRLTQQGWRPFSEAVQGQEFRCAVDRDRVALISDAAVYLFSAASSRAPSRIGIGFTKIPGFRGPVFPAAALLSEDSILLAYDQGEFGGALYRVTLSDPTTPAKVLDDVKFLARSPSGVIWAASGLGHMGGEHGALYRIDGPEPRVVASISGYLMDNGPPRISERSGIEFPALTTVAGLAFENTERPIVVFPELGVFELSGDRFTARYSGTLFLTYRGSLRGLPVSTGSYPVGVVATTSGDLYVASGSLGVFWIRGVGQELTLKQLTFARRTQPRPRPPPRLR